jgi:hypothetical protein
MWVGIKVFYTIKTQNYGVKKTVMYPKKYMKINV